KETGFDAEFHDQKTAHGEGDAADPDGPLCGNGPLSITTSTLRRRLGRNASTRVRDGCSDWLTKRLGSRSLWGDVRFDIDRRLRLVNGRIRLWFRHLPSEANVGCRISGLRGNLRRSRDIVSARFGNSLRYDRDRRSSRMA